MIGKVVFVLKTLALIFLGEYNKRVEKQRRKKCRFYSINVQNATKNLTSL